METKKIVIDDMEFSIQQFNAMKAMILEKRVMAVVMPVVTPILDVKDLDSQLDFSKLGKSFGEAFSKLSDDDFKSLVLDLLSSTYLNIKGRPELINESIFNIHFVGKILIVYKLIWNIMQVNRFGFFEMVRGGLGIDLTGILQKGKDKTKTLFNDSES